MLKQVGSQDITPMAVTNSAITHEPGKGTHFNFWSGEEFIWKVVGSTTGGVVDIGEMVVQPGIAVPEHIHHWNDEAFYVLEGQFLLTVAGREHILEPGAFVFVPRGVRHLWVNNGSEPARIMLTFTPGGMDQFFVEMDPLLREPMDLEKILPVCAKYGYELKGPVPERPKLDGRSSRAASGRPQGSPLGSLSSTRMRYPTVPVTHCNAASVSGEGRKIVTVSM